MMGEEIAKLLNDELYPGKEKFGVLTKNCEKSKHLETASMFIYGMPIDFVNLRSETYSTDSRVPTVVKNLFLINSILKNLGNRNT